METEQREYISYIYPFNSRNPVLRVCYYSLSWFNSQNVDIYFIGGSTLLCVGVMGAMHISCVFHTYLKRLHKLRVFLVFIHRRLLTPEILLAVSISKTLLYYTGCSREIGDYKTTTSNSNTVFTKL
jgi:hypothetical protein